MNFYPSADSTNVGPRQHFENQTSVTQFDVRSQQQQLDCMALSIHQVRPQIQCDDPAPVDNGWQQQCDQSSNTLARASWSQHAPDENFKCEYQISNALWRDGHQRPFVDLNVSSQLSDMSQLRQLENQDSTAQLSSRWHEAQNNSAELSAVRLPTFIYREPLPQYVPDESSPMPYHGKVVPPERLRSYVVSREQARLDPPGYPGQSQDSNFALQSRPPPPETFMAWSIVSMLCCCLLLGIAALVCSGGVMAEYAAGRYDKAQSKSKYALSLNIASTVVGVVFIVVFGIIQGITITNAHAAG